MRTAEADEAPINKLPMVGVLCPDSSMDASYFASALARRIADVADGNRPVALIDGHGMLGGIDVLADLDQVPGPRWAALAHTNGDVDGATLLEALPTRDRVAVLSVGRDAPGLPDSSAVTHTVTALRDASQACVVALGHCLEVTAMCDVVVLLVRGTVGALAAVDHVIRSLSGPQLLGVALEMSAANRDVVSESLGLTLVASAAARWRIGPVCASSVLMGEWPGQSDRTMRRLVHDVASVVASRGRSLAWA